MDVRATELSAILAESPVSSNEVARAVSVLRAMRDNGIAPEERAAVYELVQAASGWAERAQIGADAAQVLAELGDLIAARYDDGQLAATHYVRSLELAPTDLNVPERATLHLTRIGATDALRQVLEEHVRTLDGMPWVDDLLRTAARARLEQLRPAKPLRAPRRDDTPTTPHTRKRRRSGAFTPTPEPTPPEPMPLTSSASRSVPPVREPRPLRSLLGVSFALLVALVFVSDPSGTPSRMLEPTTEPRPVPRAPSLLAPEPGVMAPVAAEAAVQVRASEPSKEVEATRVRVSLARASIRVHAALIARKDVVRAVTPALEQAERCTLTRALYQPASFEVLWLVRPSGRIERLVVRGVPLSLGTKERDCIVAALNDVRFPRGERDLMRIRGNITLLSR